MNYIDVHPAPAAGSRQWLLDEVNETLFDSVTHPGVETVTGWNARTGDLAENCGWVFTGSRN